MKKLTFITGNQDKADYLAKYLGHPVAHQKLDLDELQSLDLRQITEHKVKQAYDVIKSPVLVEDVALEFHALGKLPGPFIKFFLDQMSEQAICDLLASKDRSAVARCVFGYYDGQLLKLFEGSLNGKIATEPAGQNGYGWDRIFIPDGYDITRAQMSESDDKATYLKIKPLAQVKEFLTQQSAT